MLDPVQSRALEQARHRPVRVSGFPGSGLSHLARAIAEDASRRGLSCLLVGSSPTLDRPIGPLPRPPRLHPVLARRSTAPVEAAAPAVRRGDVALRAALDPDGAATALRLHARAEALLARHALAPEEIEGGVEGARDPAREAALRLAALDARAAADGIWRSGASGRTLGELIRAATQGLAEGADMPRAALVLTRDPEAFERGLGKIHSAPGSRLQAGLEMLRAALDPWAWRWNLHDVADAREWAARQADLFEQVGDLLDRAGTFETAIADPGAPPDAVRTLQVWRTRFPDRDEAVALDACRRLGREHREQADRLSRFMPEHAGRPLDAIRNLSVPGQERRNASGDPQPVRASHLALRRLSRAAAGLERLFPPDAWDAILAAGLDDLLDGQPPLPTDDRARAAIELREIRGAFAELGFGDVLALPDFPDLVLGATLAPERPRAGHGGASFLDLLLPDPPPAPVPDAGAGGTIQRVRSDADIPAVGDDYDVVVLDDEAGASNALMEAIDGIGTLTHAIGVAGGDSDGFALDRPHRQRDVVLANLASGYVAHPFWLGSPAGAGVVVRRLPAAGPDELRAGAEAVAGALREAGYDGALLEGDGEATVRADYVVAFAGEAGDDLVRRAAAGARDGVVVVCRTFEARLPDIRAEGDDAGLGSHGWSLAAAVGEGRIFTRQGKSAVLVREPAWNDMASESVADRVSRLAGLGWRPVVDWIGRPRDPAELSDLLASAAIGPDPRVRKIMEGHPLAANG